MYKNQIIFYVATFFLFSLGCLAHVDASSAPTISSTAPSSGSVDGGTSVTISGANFINEGNLPDFSSFATVWYVSSVGNDVTGDGSVLNPYATLNKAVDVAVDGDGIYMLAGTYRAIPDSATFSCIFDSEKDLHIFGQNADTVIECYGSDSTTRDASVIGLNNTDSVLSNIKIDFYPNRSANYSNAIFRWARGTYRNIFVENKSTTRWSYTYDNTNTAINIYNSVFKSHGYSTSDYSGAAIYTNCLFDVVPSRGTKNYSLTRTITDADWDVNKTFSADLTNTGDPTILNPNGSRSHIGVLGGVYAWGSYSSVYFGDIVSLTRFVDVNTLIATTPVHDSGVVDVHVVNSDTQSTTLVNGFAYAPTAVTIQNPNQTKIDAALTDGYITTTGSSDSASSAQTQVKLTLQTTAAKAIFPINTIITENSEGNNNFNFQNLTLTEVNIKSEQPSSRVAVQLGIPNEKLEFSEDVTLTLAVGGAFNGQELDIFYQNAGESTWNTQGTCIVTDGNCTFVTDHATIYTINGIHQVVGDAPVNVNVEVQDTLSLDCYDSSTASGDTVITLGTTTSPGIVTAGTPAVGQSVCKVTTNDDQGYYLTLVNANPSTEVLTHADPYTATIHELNDLTNYVYATQNTQNWSVPMTKGLGFSVINFPDTNMTNNGFDGIWTDTNVCPEGINIDTNKYAGIPDTAQAIAAVTQYESGVTTTGICYKVDVPPSQSSGQYFGEVIYTAISDASSYYN